MKMRKVLLAALTTFTFTAAVFTTGCGSQGAGTEQKKEITAAESSQGTALADTGIITLSVNPEISIEYDEEGKVTALTGKNVDGEGIVSAYQDYQGKDCSIVLEELINRINEAGYFVDEIDGHKKNIVIQMEPGSVLPDDDFLETISRNTQEAVAGLELTSDIVTIDDDDYDERYAKNGQPSPYISLDKAKEIALAQADISAADAVFEDKEFDFDDGIAIYELEFTAGNNEYEYDVHAVTGKILKAVHHVVGQTVEDTDYGTGNDGVTDYSTTDYGPDNDGITDYGDTDYGPNNDGVTDYSEAEDTDYGPNNDGVTDYNTSGIDDTDYGPNNDGVTDYDDTDDDTDDDMDDDIDDDGDDD